MKIGFVLDDSLDSTDGVQQYILGLGDWLREQKHEVHYLVGQTKRRDIPNIHSLSRNITVRFNGNRMSIPLPASRQRITSLLHREQFDVLHVQMPYSPMLGAKVIRHAPPQTVCVGTFHILPLGWLQRWSAKALAVVSFSSLRKLGKVFSVSAPAKAFAQTLGIYSDVLSNVVETKRFAHGSKLPEYANTFTVVFLGRLVERKGAAQLLAAIKVLVDRQSIPNLKVVLCGTGPQQEQLQAWASTRGLDHVVEFAGFITEEQKADYLKTADVAIFPSLGGESFGIVLIEAMAAGSGVVLGGDNQGYHSVLHEVPASLFDPRDPRLVADILHRAYADQAWAHQVHKQQQELVKQYDVAVVGKKLVSYYQDLRGEGVAQ